jgi:hypothetical protein
MQTTTSAQASEIALQLAKAIPGARNEQDREALAKAMISWQEKAAQLEAAEMQREREDREFWAQRRPMNWVS